MQKIAKCCANKIIELKQVNEMGIIDFKGINIESVKAKLGSIIGYHKEEHKEEHNEKILKIDASQKKFIGEQVHSQHIAQQINLSLPEGTSEEERTKLMQIALEGAKQTPENNQISTEASGGARLPEKTTATPTEKFLHKHFEEYQSDNTLLLDRGGLLFIYKSREKISFSKEELGYLTQSSLRNDFPIWFWLYNHRERFESVVPLLQLVFKHNLLKIRKGVINALNDFSDTSDDIVKLMESEDDSEVLGYSISRFLEKNDTDRAQRIMANALTRRIIPVLTEKVRGNLNRVKIDLGSAERRFLHKSIEDGWQSEKLRSLELLSLSAEESDLPFLEDLLDKITYTDIVNHILACIRRIGKTNKAEYIEKEMLDTRWEESFIAHLDALIGIKYKAIFPQLLIWLSDIRKVSNKFWRGEKSEQKLEEKIQESIVALLDKENYEELIQYILNKYSPGEYEILSWRHFWVLREKKDDPEIPRLLKEEGRLNDFEQWERVTKEIEQREQTLVDNPTKSLSFIASKKSEWSFLILRKLYETLSAEEAVTQVAPLIEKFREDLTKRLSEVASSDHPEDVKKIAKNDLEMFLGDNRLFYRLDRDIKRRGSSDPEIKEDKVYEKLSKDIENYSTIEKEYFAHIFKSKTADINQILLNSLGRPYECIYDSVDTDRENVKDIVPKLLELVRGNPSPFIKLKAIEALLRLGEGDRDKLKLVVRGILFESRKNVKESRGMTKGSDDWFASEILYLWSVNALTEFGDVGDFGLVREATNREKVIARSYHRYSYYFAYEVIEELLGLTENLEDEKEKENAFSALDYLDYKWSKKILNIDK